MSSVSRVSSCGQTPSRARIADPSVGRVQAEDPQLAAGRRGDGGDHPHRRGLAGAVGAEEAERLAPAHVDVDALDRLEAAEGLRAARARATIESRSRRLGRCAWVDGHRRRGRRGHASTLAPATDTSPCRYRPAGLRDVAAVGAVRQDVRWTRRDGAGRPAASARPPGPGSRLPSPSPRRPRSAPGRRSPPGATRWSSPRPAPARRWRPSSGRSTGCADPADRQDKQHALPGALRLAAQGARRRRRAQPAGAADRHPAHRRPARRCRCPTSPSASAPATPRPPSGAGSSRTPPDILITTPESLFLMLTSQARETLRGVETVIVDEVHAVAGTKRGAHLALSLERLDALLRAARAADRALRHGPPDRGGRPLPRRQPRRSRSSRRRPTRSGTSRSSSRSRTWASSARPSGDDLEGPAAGAERRTLDLAARRGARRRPHRAAPLHDRVRQLPPARRAAHRPAQRDRHRAAPARRSRRRAPTRRPPAQIMAQSGAVRAARRRSSPAPTTAR